MGHQLLTGHKHSTLTPTVMLLTHKKKGSQTLCYRAVLTIPPERASSLYFYYEILK